jgi:Tyrosyl-DNA phosphodiesterase
MCSHGWNATDNRKTDEPSKSQTQPHDLTTQASEPAGLLGLDRKKMEEERLARLAARKRQASGGPNDLLQPDGPVKKQRLESHALEKPSAVSPQVARPRKPATNDFILSPKAGPKMEFPNGAVRLTHSASQSRTEGSKDIKFEEVVLKDHLKMAILSSYQWDLDWIFSKINRLSTKLVMALAAKTPEEKRMHESDANQYGIKCCFPPMEGETGAMHSKLMLLVFSDFMRIVITSANLVPYDWGETGVLENVVWLIDLPRLPDTAPEQTVDSLTFFGKELCFFLQKSEMPDFVLRGVLKFDFATTAPFAFIHSVGGAHLGPGLQKTGFNCLARAVRTLNLRPPGNGSAVPKLHYATASLGALNDFLLGALLAATKGISTANSTRDSGKGGSGKAGAAANARLAQASKDREHVRVYFPSAKTVSSSRGGEGAAGTITARKEWYEKPTFPRDVMRDSVCMRRGMLSHAKIILCHSKDGETAWAYVGSHNLSEAAWGKVVKDRPTGQMKLVLRNWECGVLIPVPIEKLASTDLPTPKTDATSDIASKSNGHHSEMDSASLDVELGISDDKDDKSGNNKSRGSLSSSSEDSSTPLTEDGSRLRRLFSPVLNIPFTIPGARYSIGDRPWFFGSFGNGTKSS